MADTTNTSTTGVGQQTGTESSLSNWAGDYVTNMLGKGQALADQPYQAYTGPLTAGQSDLQTQAFQGIAGLTIPTDQMKAFTPSQFTTADAQRLMNPYLESALNPQIEEARRQAAINNLANRTAATRAGAFGGGRGALMEMEGQRGLQANLANITGQGYKTAYDQALAQFNKEQSQGLEATTAAQNYGLGVLQKQADFGKTAQDIEQQGITADIKQFQEERDYPYKQVQYMQSLLQGLPLAAQTYSYSQPSALSEILSGSGGIMDLYDRLFPGSSTSKVTETTSSQTNAQPGYRYFSDGTSIDSAGRYYKNGELIWSPSTTSDTPTP